ncbi:hypothetical protein [Aequorivita nionensis]|uniref:hypothetical protein n=1 Tax=Aequorivita nionensis TaxID=1287690 RepID=UPI002C097357|nr:hypothetical protein [Aequorivita sp.]
MTILFETLDYTKWALYVGVFVVAVLKYPLYKKTPLVFFPIVLLFTIVAEFSGRYVRDVYELPNAIIYNIYYIFYFSLLIYIFMKVIDVEKFKNYIKIGIGVYWLFYLGDWLFTNFMEIGFMISYFVGAGVLVFAIILYYISILQSSLVLVVKNDLLFWVSVGLFLFFIGYVPIKIIRTMFYEASNFFELLMVIQLSLIVVMYLFFLTGFLWMKKRS